MSPEKHSEVDPSPPQTMGETAPAPIRPVPRPSNPDLTGAEVLARLEWLDDLMFAAIDGDPVALETAIDTWGKMLNELGKDALEESRHQYLRHAQSVWHELRQQPNHPPHKVFAAIEIISLLADKAW